MAGTGNPAPRQPRNPAQRPMPPARPSGSAPAPLRKPPQVLMIKKEEEVVAEAPLAPSPSSPAAAPLRPPSSPPADEDRFSMDALEGLTMADLLGPATDRRGSSASRGSATATATATATNAGAEAAPAPASRQARTVDDFDFDEEAFLAALDENAPVGTTGEVVKGVVIGMESDGVYVDIGGKAPGFMPKSECGLGVITNLKERFPKGLPIEVLVTREQNADGMVTISARALALRHSWEKVRQLEKEGKVVQVKVSGFNRGGVTCDLEGLRGFIPRSQLNEGENHEALVGQTLGVAFLEVNAETRKLVLSEKRAASAARFATLEVGQLVEGHVASIKPYGYFVDLGGVSGLLHHSCITGGVLRDLREAFQQGEAIKALVTAIDPARGRIALNTALLEGPAGELLIAKETVMAEAEDRAHRARSLLRQQEQDAG
ncbi:MULTISPECIES: S1 RNA-binding domain-containing protein [unclassified Cyanobium]|uniref:S1 RNA-binding domain-containing protein n=1 Tax=unclassified Cyanobium TaxID=2627006 RepID=UPI0020CE2ADB|nr:MULTISPECIES: S1 RNA-binding domain-containing protein [unclassified Cyanobium]MCP9832934.1 30S ribosomal protein S1 [Cyanobium sp. La Preciosa 7G6]MCP9935684.1 30S ribosomal protein S1 [Cyanobium sp. Aljojuca 7A6]